jgi:hypothetical protein
MPSAANAKRKSTEKRIRSKSDIYNLTSKSLAARAGADCVMSVTVEQLQLRR